MRLKSDPPTEGLVPAQVGEEGLQQPAVAAGVIVSETLTFGRTAERILELVLVSGVGVGEHSQSVTGRWCER